MAERNQARVSLTTDERRTQRRLYWIAGGIGLVAVCMAVRVVWGPSAATAGAPGKQMPAVAAAPTNSPQTEEQKKSQVMAMVNGEKITRQQLADEALLHYGNEVLEALLNKTLILEACRKRGIQVEQTEVAAEVDRMAQRFGVATDQWLKMLKEERNITPEQYAKDIIWPTVALRKLAEQRVQPTEDEVRAAFDTQFGPAVQVRLIVVTELPKAREVLGQARSSPADFGELAKKYSEDVSSASAKGLIQPIRKNLGDVNLERVAFAMQEGEISDLIAVNNQFAILKCERQIPARATYEQILAERGKDRNDAVYRTLWEACRDKKMRQAAADIFGELQHESRLDVVWTDPVRRKQQPGVAATVGEKVITTAELADECVERNGTQTLEGAINRRLLEQAARRDKIEVSEQELDQEVARAAMSMGRLKPDGTPDVETWLKEVLEEQKTTVELYRRDSVWPSVVLRRLVEKKVEVSQEDLQRGYEANYGPRVRIRAIVFHGNQLRKAQEVWDMARSKPTLENFGDLAAEYSVEATSRVLRGEVPPVQKWGGQPVLEREAFALKSGEISGVFQLGDKWVIVYCEGETKPVDARMDEVRQLLIADVAEKKLRNAMAQEFSHLQESSSIDNFLTHTSRSPNKGQSIDSIVGQGAPVPTRDSEVRPAAATAPLTNRR
ncbi:MAG: peptidylprolyl isomerase [Planctomycetes bacterium]|nr:peptidylprolyl isomerase [Planctomycetota bacterium]